MRISDRLNQQASLLHERAGDIAALEREHERLRDGVLDLAKKCESKSLRGIPTPNAPRNYGLRDVAKEARELLGEDQQ